jgi:stearoyl-CoA desaturase (delta-9 desaturase)
VTGSDGGGRLRRGWRDINPWSGIPLLFFHAGSLLVLWVGFSWPALAAFLIVYWLQIFGISAGFHRYFAHRSFRTSRAFRFLLALIGTSASQMGPLWWSSHHRRHHRYADREGDLHSPGLDGFLWSHVGWILCDEYAPTDVSYVKDWARYPELRWLDRLRQLPPLAVGAITFGAGHWLAATRPELGANGLQLLVWGWLLATTVCYQVTFCINSLTHMIGRRRFATPDESRNSLFLALLTNGEGWHNNHHRYPSSERQGFYWWEIDVTHYMLRGLALLGLVWDLKSPPPKVYEEALATARAGDGARGR